MPMHKMPMKKKDMPASHAHMTPKEHEEAMKAMMGGAPKAGPKSKKRGK